MNASMWADFAALPTATQVAIVVGIAAVLCIGEWSWGRDKG